MSTELTGQQEQAAALVATDTQSDRTIAAAVGVDPRTITRWKKHPLFVERVSLLRAELAQRIADEELFQKEGRLRLLVRTVRRIEAVIEARAADGLMHTPGGDTGIIAQRVIPGARVFQFEVDAVLLKELREYTKQIAQEMGQWTEKREHSGEVSFNVAGFFEEIDRRWGESRREHQQISLTDSSGSSPTMGRLSG